MELISIAPEEMKPISTIDEIAWIKFAGVGHKVPI
jgi:hypothetical protein